MVGIVADDTIGANDMGLVFRKYQYLVISLAYFGDEKLKADSNVC